MLGSCARKLASVPADEDWRTIAGAVSPAGMADCVDSVGLPMIDGTTLPTDIAKQVTDDAASLADAGILFPAESDGTLSPTEPGNSIPSIGRTSHIHGDRFSKVGQEQYPSRVRWDRYLNRNGRKQHSSRVGLGTVSRQGQSGTTSHLGQGLLETVSQQERPETAF